MESLPLGIPWSSLYFFPLLLSRIYFNALQGANRLPSECGMCNSDYFPVHPCPANAYCTQMHIHCSDIRALATMVSREWRSDSTVKQKAVNSLRCLELGVQCIAKRVEMCHVVLLVSLLTMCIKVLLPHYWSQFMHTPAYYEVCSAQS